MVAEASRYNHINDFASPMISTSAARCLTITYKREWQNTLLIQVLDSKSVSTTLKTLSDPDPLPFTIRRLKTGSGSGPGSGSGTGSGYEG